MGRLPEESLYTFSVDIGSGDHLVSARRILQSGLPAHMRSMAGGGTPSLESCLAVASGKGNTG
jgi:hypothetical protein